MSELPVSAPPTRKGFRATPAIECAGLYCEAKPCSLIWDAADDAMEAARLTGKPVVFFFNGMYYKISPKTTREEFALMWNARNDDEQK